MSAIRHLAVSGSGSLLAAAEFESIVHLYDLNSLTQIRTIKTTLDFGGSRLAVSFDGTVLAVGAYQRYGIAGYSTLDGSEIWRRKDLKKVQRLRFSQDSHRLFCCFDDRACERLNPLDGKSGRTLRGVRNCWASSLGHVYLLQRARDYLIATDESNVAVIPKISFAALSAAFSPSEVCVSEVGNSVRSFSSQTGELLWRHDLQESSHFFRVAYLVSKKHFVGIARAFKYDGNYALYRFDHDTGKASPYAQIPDAYECVFHSDGARLTTASGAIIDVETGRIVANLDFPEKPPKSS